MSLTNHPLLVRAAEARARRWREGGQVAREDLVVGVGVNEEDLVAAVVCLMDQWERMRQDEAADVVELHSGTRVRPLVRRRERSAEVIPLPWSLNRRVDG